MTDTHGEVPVIAIDAEGLRAYVAERDAAIRQLFHWKSCRDGFWFGEYVHPSGWSAPFRLSIEVPQTPDVLREVERQIVAEAATRGVR